MDPGDLERFLAEFQPWVKSGHETRAVLTSVARLEKMLSRLLEYRIRMSPAKLREKLLGGYGPLSTFAAKIDIAEAFGIIDNRTAELMRVVKNVRNEFAHSSEGVDLDAPQLARACAKLPEAHDRIPAEGNMAKFMTALMLATDGIITAMGGDGKTWVERVTVPMQNDLD